MVGTDDDDKLVEQAAIEMPQASSDNDSGHSSDTHEQPIGEIRGAAEREDAKGEDGKKADNNKVAQQIEKRQLERVIEKRKAEKREMENFVAEKQNAKKRNDDYDYLLQKRMKIREPVFKPTARKSTAKPTFPKLKLFSSARRSMPRISSSDSEESAINGNIQLHNKNISLIANEERDTDENNKESEKEDDNDDMATADHDEDSTDAIRYCDPELQNLVDELLSSPKK